MVIGNGMMAKAFSAYRDRADIIIFASGVSNSKETKEEPFLIEEELLLRTLKEKRDGLMIYFGTCSVYDPELMRQRYIRHKLRMEHIIENSGCNYLILRLSNVVGATDNRFTIVNFLLDKIRSGEEFDLWMNSFRNIIDIDDVIKIAGYIIDAGDKYRNEIINIAAPASIKTVELVRIVEEITGKKAVYREVSQGTEYFIDTRASDEICYNIGIVFDDNYIRNTIRKYSEKRN